VVECITWTLSRETLAKSRRRLLSITASRTSPEKRTEWFLDGFVFHCDAEGLRLGLGECYGWRIHPMIGGKFEFENIQIFSLSVYESLMGQLLPRWKQLPPGQPIPRIEIT
jgi:hypothetical protein